MGTLNEVKGQKHLKEELAHKRQNVNCSVPVILHYFLLNDCDISFCAGQVS